MHLKDALLCIDCDDVFVLGESMCNPRCPSCGSSVFVPLSCWIQTLTAFDKLNKAQYAASTKKYAGSEIYPKPIAA